VLSTFVIRLDGDEEVLFPTFDDGVINKLATSKIKENLLISGLWTSFRTRPYSTLADPHTMPYAILITAIDTNPLAPDPMVIINAAADDFRRGVTLIAKLTEGNLFVCKSAESQFPIEENNNINIASFSGPHPAGLVGTHIHFLCPVSTTRTVWHIGYQDVIAIGHLFNSGRRGLP